MRKESVQSFNGCMNNIWVKIGNCTQEEGSAALCIVTGNSGSVPGKTGAKMIVYGDGRIEGTVGGGGLEKRAIGDALDCIRAKMPRTITYDLQKDLGMTCGGTVTIYMEPVSKPPRLYIFGAGHIGRILARYASDLDFDTFVVDWRTDLPATDRNAAYQMICKPYLDAVNEISFDRDCYLVIVTPNHEMDEEVLAAVGKKDVAYIGLIGSKRKIEKLRSEFLEKNTLTKAEIDRVDMPIGIKFNAITPAEIAVSILAKLIDVKNNRAAG